MKKLLSILLCLSMLFMFSACGKEKTEKKEEAKPEIQYLPYSLEFGMTYDQAKEALKDFPAINPASSNDGYASDRFAPEFSAYEDFFAVDSDKLYESAINGDGLVYDPGYFFSFNESKKLYEFCVMTNIYKSESSVEYLLNHYIDFFTEKTGKEPTENENGDSITATFETDNLIIEIHAEANGSDYLIYVLMHNTEYELSE